MSYLDNRELRKTADFSGNSPLRITGTVTTEDPAGQSEWSAGLGRGFDPSSWVILDSGSVPAIPGVEWTISVQPTPQAPGLGYIGALHKPGDPMDTSFTDPASGKIISVMFSGSTPGSGQMPTRQELESAAAKFRTSAEYAELRGFLLSATLNKVTGTPVSGAGVCSTDRFEYGPLQGVDCATAKAIHQQIIDGRYTAHGNAGAETEMGYYCHRTTTGEVLSDPQIHVSQCYENWPPKVEIFKIWRKGTMPRP